jgi:hypothetical protein
MELGIGNDNSELESGIKLWAKIGLELGETIKKQNETNERLWRRLQFATPVRTWQTASGVFPASGNLVLNFGNPDLGSYWNIRSFAIGGTDINITAAGKFGLYVSGFSAPGFSPGMSQLIDGGGTYGGADQMPYSENYGNDSYRINDSEQIYCVIFGGTAGQTYVANLSALVYNAAAALGNDFNIG